jgi:N-acetylglucosamine kinase-like BadF-type ATPase
LFPFLALEVMNAARDGDAAAREIMHWAGKELAWLAVAVARQLEMENDEVEVIQSGSVFEAGELIAEPIKKLVLKHCPRAKLTRLDGPPVVSAVILGMEQAGFDGDVVREMIVGTATEIVK